MQNIKTYLFDFDGTLVDSMPTYVAAMLRILDENQVIMEGYSIIIGDNLTYSIDSRDFGAVKNEDILGKVVFRYFSQNGKIKVLK